MENKRIFSGLAIGIILIIAIIFGGYFWMQNKEEVLPGKFGPGGMPIQTFEECVAAGNPVMKSYPPQCRTKDGRSFTQQVESKNTCGNGTCEDVACMAIGCPKPETPENCPVDCKEKAINDLSSWQTYRNDKYGFEVKYPENWSIKNEKNGLGGQLDRFFFCRDKKDILNCIYVEVYDNATAAQIIDLGSGDSTKHSIFKKDPNFIEIWLAVDDEIKNENDKNYFQKVFDNMVKTFKFIN